MRHEYAKVLLDGGLQGVQEMVNDLSWYGRFRNGSVYQIVQITPVAEARVHRYPKDVGIKV